MAFQTRDIQKSHRIYVLSCWQEGAGSSEVDGEWRFSIEHVGAESQRYGFASMETVFAYLQLELTGKWSEKLVVPLADQVGASPEQPEL